MDEYLDQYGSNLEDFSHLDLRVEFLPLDTSLTEHESTSLS